MFRLLSASHHQALHNRVRPDDSGFRGLVVSMLEHRGFKPSRSRRDFSGEKILSMPSFRGEVKPSVALWQVKETYNDVEVAFVRLNLIGQFSPIVPSFADGGLSRRLTWSASGDERGNQKRG
jgi:hypothetical protein